MRKQSDRYINIITESDNREIRLTLSKLGTKVALMEARGYTKKQQNDYVFKFLRDIERSRMNESILGFFQQGIQGWVGGKLANMLGLKEDTFIRKVFVNFIENLEVSKVQQMFSGEGACRPLVQELAGAVQEAFVEKGVQSLGLEPTGPFGKAVQESLQAAFAEEGIFVDKITDLVCSINISDLLPGGTEAPQQAAEAT